MASNASTDSYPAIAYILIGDDAIYVGNSAVDVYRNWSIADTFKSNRSTISSLEILNQPRLLAIFGDSTLSLHKVDDLNSSQLSLTGILFISTLNSSLSSLSAEAAMQGRCSIRRSHKDSSHTQPTQSKLAAVSKRKVSIYTWTHDKQDDVEIPLPNTPKVVVILNPFTAYIAYSASEYSIIQFDMKSSSVYSINDVVLPSNQTSYKSSLTAGLTGFLYRSKPLITAIDTQHVALIDGTLLVILDQDGNLENSTSIPASADDIATASPFIYVSIPQNNQSTGVHVYSSYTLELVQVIPTEAKFLHHTHSTLYLDASSGISALEIVNRKQLIDKSIEQGKYEEALGLLESGKELDEDERTQLQLKILQLYSISLVDAGMIDDAIDIFIELETNPAKVIALFPENISGRLYTPKDEWSTLFGDFAKLYKPAHDHTDEKDDLEIVKNSNSMSSFKSDNDAASVKSTSTSRTNRTAKKEKSVVEALLRYLTDRRQKVKGAINYKQQEAGSSYNPLTTKLTDYSKEELLNLPSTSAESLNGDDLAILAAVVDTALFKAYIETRPALVGSLCRLENYCQPEEVEVSLLDRKKYSELVSLYKSKNIHEKALDLLKRLCFEDEDKDIEPCVSYTQQLGSEYIDLILQKSDWMFDIDKENAMHVNDERVESLPRLRVAQYLHKIELDLCLQYLQHVTGELNDQEPALHDYYADTLLQAASLSRNTPLFEDKYSAFVQFLSQSQQYSPKERLRGIPADDMYLARAILVDRLGRHEEALRIYARQLQDFEKAVTYCRRMEHVDREIYTKLLKLYLRTDESKGRRTNSQASSYFRGSSVAVSPTHSQSQDDELSIANVNMNEALMLLNSHPTKFDLKEVLNMIPGVTCLNELQTFLLRSYKAMISKQRWRSVTANIRKAEDTRLAAKLVDLESRFVVVDDNRICPECKKRLGNSVISVHPPRGQVTHLGCKDRFNEKLQAARGFTMDDI
ncbi:hypothetical protein E3P99_02716 [Wallemia hederae]|uniref:CTLH domain-containing protein n=1 Tax=Wallemia hederae TaxID=1540922 RepID=A0A4T0FJ36_9BASI|nr:hypothetical protein E3P99_02716 [Wallemia hederae]